jgi:hypothetical protein
MVGEEQAEELRAAVGGAARAGTVDDGAHSAPYGPAEEVRP